MIHLQRRTSDLIPSRDSGLYLIDKRRAVSKVWRQKTACGFKVQSLSGCDSMCGALVS